MTKEQAEILRDVVNAILETAFTARHRVLSMAAVNWGDLGCTDVEERTSLLTGSKLITVIIEEASPEAAQLIKFVSHALEQHGYKDVYVCTEW